MPSGTALLTYSFAWGIGHGLLPRAEYEPAVRRGWQALQNAIQPDGWQCQTNVAAAALRC